MACTSAGPKSETTRNKGVQQPCWTYHPCHGFCPDSRQSPCRSRGLADPWTGSMCPRWLQVLIEMRTQFVPTAHLETCDQPAHADYWGCVSRGHGVPPYMLPLQLAGCGAGPCVLALLIMGNWRPGRVGTYLVAGSRHSRLQSMHRLHSPLRLLRLWNAPGHTRGSP